MVLFCWETFPSLQKHPSRTYSSQAKQLQLMHRIAATNKYSKVMHSACLWAGLAAKGGNTGISPPSFLYLCALVPDAPCSGCWASAPTLFYVSDNSDHMYLQIQHQNALIYTTMVNTTPQLLFFFLVTRTNYCLSLVQTMLAPWDWRQYWKINAAFPLDFQLTLAK